MTENEVSQDVVKCPVCGETFFAVGYEGSEIACAHPECPRVFRYFGSQWYMVLLSSGVDGRLAT